MRSIKLMLLVMGVFTVIATGCGGGGGGDTSPAASVLSGTFIDSPVAGLEYSTATQAGITDNQGTFLYQSGEVITFAIGGIILGQATASPIMTPIDLVDGATSENDPAVVNICRFLQTLDDDDNLVNGIEITELVRNAALDASLNFAVDCATFGDDTQVKDLVSELTGLTSTGEKILVSEAEALAHFRDTLAIVDGDVDYDGDGYTENQNDCDDHNDAINPGATEVCGDGVDNDCTGGDGVCPPSYFIAVHNEPSHDVYGGEVKVAESYEALVSMVAEADSYGIKLTIMLSAHCADYIVADAQRTELVRSWALGGHELAAHHHSIYHSFNWDGYTDYSIEQAKLTRLEMGHLPESYLGTLDSYMARLWALDAGIHSGCANDEYDKNAMPDAIVYDTCSGFANHGEVGVLERDSDTPDKGINEFMLVGTWNGIQRTWLAHYQITTTERTDLAIETLGTLSDGVYGVVLHSSGPDAVQLSRYMEYLHSIDPSGARSRTVTEVIEEGLLPVQTISEQTLEDVHEE